MKDPNRLHDLFTLAIKNRGFSPKALGYFFQAKTTPGMLSEKTFSPPLGDRRFGALRQYFCQPPTLFGRRWQLAGFSSFPFHEKRIEFGQGACLQNQFAKIALVA